MVVQGGDLGCAVLLLVCKVSTPQERGSVIWYGSLWTSSVSKEEVVFIASLRHVEPTYSNHGTVVSLLHVLYMTSINVVCMHLLCIVCLCVCVCVFTCV